MTSSSVPGRDATAVPSLDTTERIDPELTSRKSFLQFSSFHHFIADVAFYVLTRGKNNFNILRFLLFRRDFWLRSSRFLIFLWGFPGIYPSSGDTTVEVIYIV